MFNQVLKNIFFMTALCSPLLCGAQSTLVFAISEGTSGGIQSPTAGDKYQVIAKAIERATKRRVNIVMARSFSQLEASLKDQNFDFVMARPSDYPARAIRDYGYQYVATAKPDGHCLFVVPTGSSIQSLEQAKGKRWLMPEKVAYMSKFCQAELRDKGIRTETEKVIRTQDQSFTKNYLKEQLVDVAGIASYSGLGRALDANGLRLIHQSIPQPYFPLIANKKIPLAQIEALQSELIKLPSTSDGGNILVKLGIEKFDVKSEQSLTSLLNWIEK